MHLVIHYDKLVVVFLSHIFYMIVCRFIQRLQLLWCHTRSYEFCYDIFVCIRTDGVQTFSSLKVLGLSFLRIKMIIHYNKLVVVFLSHFACMILCRFAERLLLLRFLTRCDLSVWFLGDGITTFFIFDKGGFRKMYLIVLVRFAERL